MPVKHVFAEVDGQSVPVRESTARAMVKDHGWFILREEADLLRVCPPGQVGKHVPVASSRIMLMHWTDAQPIE